MGATTIYPHSCFMSYGCVVMSAIEAQRRLISELLVMLNKKVVVILDNGRRYEGTLVGFDHPTLNVMLNDAVDGEGKHYPKVLIKGERVSEMTVAEVPLFDPEDFARYIISAMKLRSDAVKVIPEARAVIILNNIRVTETGVEGRGPTARTVHQFWEKYMSERRRKLHG